MRVKVTVSTTMQYESVVEAATEVEAVQVAMLDALIQDSYDYGGQTAEWEVMPDSTPLKPDKVKQERLKLIKSRAAKLHDIESR